MDNYSNENLDKLLGTGNQSFVSRRTLVVDNGDDLMGTNATGVFVEKKFNNETKKVEKIQFAPEFDGVILSSQAQLFDKGKVPTWRTDEFNPLVKEEQIAIYPLIDGKTIKEQDGRIKKSFASYDQIKASRQITNLHGKAQSTYNYFVILYVGVDNEIIKLKFKGTARSNFFDYNKVMYKYKAKMYDVLTRFYTYIEKSTGKHSINFELIKNKEGSPVSVDILKIRDMRVEIAQGFLQLKELRSYGTQKIEAPEEEVAYEIDNDPEIKDNEIVREEIKLSDVPFE